jgi:hypothetical protein
MPRFSLEGSAKDNDSFRLGTRLGESAGKIFSLTRLSLLLPDAGSQLHLIRIIRPRNAPRKKDKTDKKQYSFHGTPCFSTALLTGQCFLAGRQRGSVAFDLSIFRCLSLASLSAIIKNMNSRRVDRILSSSAETLSVPVADLPGALRNS